jgi:HSP20 family protein
MTLTRRPNERSVVPLRTLERLFGDWQLAPIEMGFNALTPAMDVRESGDNYIVEVDLPGVDPANTEVVIEGRTLTIKGHFAEESEREEGNYLLRERRRGQFLRAVALPGMVEVDKVTSNYENGQLIITLPKAEHSRARRVQIGGGRSTNDKGKSSKS